MDEITHVIPAPVIDAKTAVAMGHPPDRVLVGYWCGTPADRQISAVGAPPLTHPRQHADPTMPLDERQRIAEALDAAPLVRRSQTTVVDLLDPGVPLASGAVSRRHLPAGERSAEGYQWPEALSTYVRDYGLRLPAQLLQALHVVDAPTPEEPVQPPTPPQPKAPPVTLPPSPKSASGPMDGPPRPVDPAQLEGPDYELIGVLAYVSTAVDISAEHLPPRFVAWGTGPDGAFKLERMLRHVYVDVGPSTQAVLDGLAVTVPHRVESLMAGDIGQLVS